MITWKLIAVDLLLLAGALFTYRGVRGVIAALRSMEEDKRALERFYRAAREGIGGVALAVIAAGLWAESDGLVVFGLVFLGEELYETTMAAAVTRWGREREERERAGEGAIVT